MEYKKDYNPIWIYVLFMIVVSSVLGTVLYFITPNHAIFITNIIVFFLLFGILLFIYRKRVLEDIRRLSWKNALIILAISFVMFFIIDFLASLLPTAKNEETVVELVKNYHIWMILPIGVFGPFVEEMVFRYSFRSFLKKDIVFLIISSLVFGILHVSTLGIEILVYILMGFYFGLIYLKTKENIAASTLAHITNNMIEIIMLLFL